ncbi:MAG: hypothetical protein EOO63_16270 [Hymenobacter sp.]|nr:MAG: hypothetical protein EOO63_16270 [Hymenobacter sp.]
MSPYDDPHVSAGELADYLDQLRLEATPPLATLLASPCLPSCSNALLSCLLFPLLPLRLWIGKNRVKQHGCHYDKYPRQARGSLSIRHSNK